MKTQSNNLLREMAEARRQTDVLFALVKKRAFHERPIPERNRILFYLGHLEAFDWNQIAQQAFSLPAFNAEFDQLFAFGIDPKPGRLPNDKPSDWPAVPEIETYNRQVRAALDKALPAAPSDLIQVALEHRLMHAETFVYMLHNLPPDLKNGTLKYEEQAAPKPISKMINIPAGTATLGTDESEKFGWDNEFGSHSIFVPEFSIGKYKVTNGEYLQFMREGATAPHFWTRRGNQWFYRSMFGEIPLPLDFPVYVTFKEAEAYARWIGKALPTEAQFHRAAYGTPEGLERTYPWGEEKPDARHGNFDFQRWDPVPVTATPLGDSAFGVSQLVGNGWEWTSTLFSPFPGFKPFAFYPGYSAPFFDEDHYVLKGGSSRTGARLLRRPFRNWFRADYPYIYAGFRCAEN